MSETLSAFLVVAIIFAPAFYELIRAFKYSKHERIKAWKKVRKVLAYSVLSFIGIVTIFGILSHTNYLDYESPITYDRFDEITFENFRGLEFYRKTLYGNPHFAYVVTTIDHSVDDDRITVEARFHPSRSYVYNTHTNSEELLIHELYHFKITELYCRKAKERLSKLNQISPDIVGQIMHKVNQEERDYQRQYDHDTFHSYVLSEQRRYQRSVDSLLFLLNEYKEPSIIIHENI